MRGGSRGRYGGVCKGDKGVYVCGEVVAEELSLPDIEKGAIETIIEVAVCSRSNAWSA